MSTEIGGTPEDDKTDSQWVPITSGPKSRYVRWQIEDIGDWQKYTVDIAGHDRLCAIYGAPPVQYVFGSSPEGHQYSIAPLFNNFQQRDSPHVGAYELTIDPSQVLQFVSGQTRNGEKISKAFVARTLEWNMRHALHDITLAHISRYGWGRNGKFPPMRDFASGGNMVRILEEGGPLLLLSMMPELIASSDSLSTDARAALLPIIYFASKVALRAVNHGVGILWENNPQYMAQLFREDMLSVEELHAVTSEQLYTSLTTALFPGGILLETLIRNFAGNIVCHKPFIRHGDGKAD